MTDARSQQIEAAIADAEAAGKSWTNQTSVRRSRRKLCLVVQYLKARRAGRLDAGAVAVLEPKPASPSAPPPTPPALASPGSPLAEARAARDAAVIQEQTLAAQHTRLKQQRQAVEQRLLAPGRLSHEAG